MEISEMKHDDIQIRLKELETLIETDDADLESLGQEIKDLKSRDAYLKQRAEEQRNLRASIAEGIQPAAVLDSAEMTQEVRKDTNKMDMKEMRNTKAYIDAFAEYVKTGKDAELRTLITEAGGGEIVVPDIVADRIATAWQNDKIMQRVNRLFVKGNYTIMYEISGTDAVIHVEGTAAPTEETLTLGKVQLVPQNLKKWITVTDEVMDLKGEAFLNYLYDEIEYKIVKLAGQTVIAAIVAAALDGGSTLPYVATLKADLSATTIVDAEALLLADEASEPVAIMTRKTYAALRGVQISSGVNVGDVFNGLEPIRVAENASGLIDYDSDIAEDDAYMIVGDLAGITANFPNGDQVKFTFDETTLAPEDVVRIIGKLFVGIGVSAPGFFTVVTKAA